MRRTLALCLMGLLFITANAFALTEARMTGKVFDAETKTPLEATITIEAVEGKTFKQTVKTKKDGTYAIFLLDGTIRYKFTFTAPGYAPVSDTMKLQLGNSNKRDVPLSKGDAVAPVGAGAAPQQATGDPAVEAYNAGAALANEGKIAEAIAKIEEAVKIKPDLTAAHMALAKLYGREKMWDKAIAAANKGLEVDADDAGMWQVLYAAYTAKGDKVKAAEAQKKLPANANSLFNDAAKAINASKDAEAEPLLKQAIVADEKFAVAYYELGMLYVRAGNMAGAKENLTKYLELEPNGKDAATAREMLKYVK